MTKTKPQVMPISFTKMHGLGNDFVVINSLNQDIPNVDDLPITALANRHVGIGFDQLLIIGPSTKADYSIRIFNADGSEAEQCGNGLRCIARELHENKLCGKKVTLATKAGVFPVTIENYDEISVALGVPKIEDSLYQLRNDLPITLISLGNPHAILKVASIQDETSMLKGKAIYEHKTFSQGINVGLMQVINQSHIALRTLERGTGETYACGSNACAAVCAGIINDWIESNAPVKVDFRLGSLLIEWPGEGKPVTITGPASHVFSGSCEIVIASPV